MRNSLRFSGYHTTYGVEYFSLGVMANGKLVFLSSYKLPLVFRDRYYLFYSSNSNLKKEVSKNLFNELNQP